MVLLITIGIIGLICVTAAAFVALWDIWQQHEHLNVILIIMFTFWMAIIGPLVENIGVTIAGIALGIITWILVLIVLIKDQRLPRVNLVIASILILVAIGGTITIGIIQWANNVKHNNTPAEIIRIHKVTQEIQVPYGIKYFETEDGDTVELNLKNDNRMSYISKYLGPIDR